MDGNFAYTELKRMSEEERKGVRIIWFDDEQLDSLMSDDAEKKAEFFMNLTPEQKGEVLDRALYNDSGDYTSAMDAFLDDFTERLDNAIGEKMQEVAK